MIKKNDENRVNFSFMPNLLGCSNRKIIASKKNLKIQSFFFLVYIHMIVDITIAYNAIN